MSLRQAIASRPAILRAAPRHEARTNPSPESSAHVPVLDGIRGLAIFLVLFYHFTVDMTAQSLGMKLFLRGTNVGWCGVDLFFVLSGFLITGILHNAKNQPHRFRNFYARRALRIFPLYYGFLAAVFAILPWLSARSAPFEGLEKEGVWLGLYGTNVRIALRGDWFSLGYFWSLAVEEHFYLFWPAVVFWCRRKTVLWICGFLVLLAFVVRAWMVSHHLVLAAYCLTVCRMDALAVGSFLALAVQGPGGVNALVPLAKRLGLGCGFGLLSLALWRFNLFVVDPVVEVVGFLLFDLLFASLLVLALTTKPSGVLAVVFNLSPLRWLGRYSYGLYVYNSFFVLIAEGLGLLPRFEVGTGSTVVGRIVYVVLAAACTLGTAWLSWHLFEKHFLKLKQFFPTGRSVGPAA